MEMDWFNSKKADKRPKILQKSLENYYDDRMTEKAVDYEHLYEKVSFSPATEMEEARRKISCLDQELVQARQVWKEEKKALDARWTIATERYNGIYDSIPHLCGYYRDSFAKRERSHQKLLQEQANSEGQERELRRVTKEFVALQEVRDSQLQRLQKFEIFKDYLAKVKENSHGEYPDIREIIQRYTDLLTAKDALGARNEEIVEYAFNKQKSQENDNLIKSNEIMIYRNFLSQIVEYKDVLQEEVQRLDDTLLRIKSTSAHRTKVIGQIKMSIDNLYKQVCKYMHRPARLTYSDTLGQLSDIGISVGEMVKLSKDIKHMVKNAFVTAEAERAAQAKAKKKEEDRKRWLLEKSAGKAAGDAQALYKLPPVHEGSDAKADDLLLHHDSLPEKKKDSQ